MRSSNLPSKLLVKLRGERVGCNSLFIFQGGVKHAPESENGLSWACSVSMVHLVTVLVTLCVAVTNT